MRRRELLAGLAVATFAGCSDRVPADGVGTSTEPTVESPTETATAASTPTEAATQTPTRTETPTPDPPWSDQTQRLFDLLSEGGFNIYFRHAATDETTDVPEDRIDLDDCSTQRNLSQLGREQARLTGEAFENLGIPVGEVLSSRYCRCRQTAELAFDDVSTTGDLTHGVENRSERVIDRVTTPPENPNTNTVLVSHTCPFEARERLLGDLRLGEGDSAVFNPHARPENALVRITRSSTWRDAAQF